MKKIAIALNLDWPLYRYHQIYSGIQEYSKKNTDWNIVWDHYPERIIRRTESAYYSGIIGRIKVDSFKEAEKYDIPVVNTWYSSFLQDLPSIYIDYIKTGEMAAEHLIERGIRNFINIDYRGHRASKDFLEGFKNVIEEKKCSVEKYYISNSVTDSKFMWDKFCMNFADWVPEWKLPVGIACSLSSIGPKITTRLRECGLKIPEDVAVISSDNDLSYCEVTSPKITSIAQDYFKVGFESARMLNKQLKGETLVEKQIYIPPLNLVPRESTDFYGLKDPVLSKALRFIANNYQKGILSSDVVNNAPVSRRSLDVLFKNHIGHSILEEINRLRVGAVKRLLIESDIKISSLPSATGFSNPTHLRRVFTRHEGITPSEYKKNPNRI